MNKLLKITAFSVALVAAPALAQSEEVSEVRDLDEFTRIVIESSADVNVEVGDSQRVEVFAEDKYISQVETKVRGSTLYVSIDKGWRRHNNVNLEIQVKSLDGIIIDGSGDVAAKNINSQEFEVEIDGSGDVDLDGTCSNLIIDISGSGDVNSKHLKCSTANLDINGSGDIDVYASQSLVLDINGSGDVTIYGDPDRFRPKMNGSGEFRFVEDK